MKKHLDRIRQEKLLIEALRSGVPMNRLGRLLNMDDLLVLRAPAADREQLARRIVRAIRQVRKRYDFRCNVETTNSIA